MNATQQLHDLGQSLWLDNITRALLTSGTLSRYIRDFAVTGLAKLTISTVQAQRLTERPASDYTARLIPHCDDVAVPLEAARILWQR